MCHLCGARLRTVLPHKCRIPPVPFPPVKWCPINKPLEATLGHPRQDSLSHFEPAWVGLKIEPKKEQKRGGGFAVPKKAGLLDHVAKRKCRKVSESASK